MPHEFDIAFAAILYVFSTAALLWSLWQFAGSPLNPPLKGTRHD